jgi:transposase
MAKYSEQFRQKVVEEYLAGGVGTRRLAARYGLGHAMLRRWIASYREHGSKGLRKKFSHYDVPFKMAVLQRCGAMSCHTFSDCLVRHSRHQLRC